MKSETFPERLKALRKQNNLTQTQLGKLVGIHYTHIGKYEKGKSRPAAETLQKLAKVLRVTADYLIDGATNDIAKAELEDRELLKQFQEVEKLPDDDKTLIKTFLDAFLIKKKIQDLAIPIQ
jgi:transcriptional regulator with XRE-family HTH domain